MNNKIAVIVSSFNSEITVNLYDGAINCLKNNNIPEMNIETYWVPGALEIPYLATKIASSKQFGGIIALGAVIKGETYHYELVSENEKFNNWSHRQCNEMHLFGAIAINTRKAPTFL